MSKIYASMASGDGENQLELFDLANQPTVKVRRESFGRFLVHLRYDQAILLSIGGLLSLTVIFACGVERGKLLVRSEQLRIARQMPVQSAASSGSKEPKAPEAGKQTSAPKADAEAPVRSEAETSTPKLKQAKQKVKVAESPSLSKSRYAIQVVTFARAQSAKEELDRLRVGGQPAFIVIREGRTIVYVGPFPSKDNATDKLASLKSKYQGCFIRTL